MSAYHCNRPVSTVRAAPDEWPWLAGTKLAGQVSIAAAIPDEAQLFPLGGSSLFRGFDRGVMRLEMTVHDQRIAIGRRLVGAHDLAGLRLFDFQLRFLHA